MKRIYLLSELAIIFSPSLSVAQFSIAKGDHAFEIGGDMLAGYNYRFYQPTEKDHHKNNFILDEARFFFKGRVNTSLQYKFEMDGQIKIAHPFKSVK